MPLIKKRTKEIEGYQLDNIPYQELMDAGEPVVLKGAVKKWGLVKAGLESDALAIDYLKSFYNGKTVGTFLAPPEINGRFFYNDTLTGMNFESKRLLMDDVLDQIQQHLTDPHPPHFYIGSTTIDACLPGMRTTNDLIFNDRMFEDNAPLASIWIGNRSQVSAHYDAPNNIACCAVGRRKFTLFPPDQIANLYPGPLDPTPGGQAISMVDFSAPDYERFPGFRDAIAVGEVADLEAGDALFYPSLWWHQVEALNPFNILINYWWSTSPSFMGTPMNVLKHALLSLRDRSEQEKDGWRHIFEYYVFGAPERPRAHLPESALGELAPMDDIQARQLRAYLLNRLNR